MWSADPGKSLYSFLLSASEPLTFPKGLQFKDIRRLERAQCRAAVKPSGLEERLKEQCLFILVKRSSRKIYWEPVTTWCDKDDGIKHFTNDIESIMAQNCPLEGSSWSLGKYSSLEEQCSTGRG